MKQRSSSKSRNITRFSIALRRFGFVVLILASFGLMLLGKADNFIVEQITIITTEIMAPVVRVLSIPAAKFSHFVENVREIAHLREENSALKEENNRLKKWEFISRKLKAENTQLSALLNYSPPAEAKYITARIIAERSGAFAHSLIAYVGENNPTKKGQAVITGDGLVGRVDVAGLASSRILSLTDINSRIPVVVEKTRVRAILAGNNTYQPTLTSIAEKDKIKEGDIIVTSGIAGAFPSGIPVGIVSKIKDKTPIVQTFVDMNKLEYVRIADYGLKGILPDELICK